MSNEINTFDIEDFSFTYAGGEAPTLREINFSVSYGEFITLCGKTGSGKSTLLRNLKKVLAPEGGREGKIEFYGRDINRVSDEEQARRIGFVLQNPENQIVTDKVWHELAFGLENLGVRTNSIRTRVAEMATFFGISPWINKNVSELSGGQKQLLNLAAVMVMNPDVLILDEPTSSLDPIASEEFIDTLIKINKNIGTTVIVSEHNLEQVMSVSDRVLIMDEGRVVIDDKPEKIGNLISAKDRDFLLSMPVPLRIYTGLEGECEPEERTPLTVREGRNWLTKMFAGHTLKKERMDEAEFKSGETRITLKDVSFKYERNGDDIIKKPDMQIGRGQITVIVGGNGAGKSTLLRIISGILTPYRGKVDVSNSGDNSRVVLLPQDPQTLFVADSVAEELRDVVTGNDKGIKQEDIQREIEKICSLLDLNELLDRHAYDLSGGEQQRVAFAKVLLAGGDVYLLDEPTSGLDGMNKRQLGNIIKRLSSEGKTIVAVTHDLEFAAEYGDICYLLFDGQIMSSGVPGDFFSDNAYYTTSGNRMSRHIFGNAVTPGDVISMCRTNLRDD